jgi:hypothetical protein
LVGVPHALGDQFVELSVRAARNGFYVQGMPNTVLQDEDGHTRLNANGGIAMLGHSITLRRTQQFDGANLSIMVSNVTDDKNRLSIQGSVVGHERYERWAVSHEDDFAIAPGDSPEFACLELFVDFNILTAEDYSVFMPGGAGHRFGTSHNGRRLQPGYMWAHFLQRPALGLGGGLVMFNSPKRRRLNSTTTGAEASTTTTNEE